MADDLNFTIAQIGQAESRARAPETLRRREMLSHQWRQDVGNGTKDASSRALSFANYCMQAIINGAFEAAQPRDRRLVGDEAIEADLKRIAETGSTGRAREASFHIVNATAGLGKSYTFLSTLAKAVASNETLTAVVISPNHELSRQSYLDFCDEMGAIGAEHDEVARQFIAVDAQCKTTCSSQEGHTRMRPYNQRKQVADAGGKPELFCTASKEIHPVTKLPVSPPCSYFSRCGYWEQLRGASKIRVWFITHAAAQRSSLRIAGINTRFDIRFVDEDCLKLYIDEDEIDLSKLPERPGLTAFTRPIHNKMGSDLTQMLDSHMLYGLAYTFAITAETKKPFRDGSVEGVDVEQLKDMREVLLTLRHKHLHPWSDQTGFDPNSGSPRDTAMETNMGFTLGQLKNMREEAKHAIAVIDLLLGYIPGSGFPALGYTPKIIGEGERNIKIAIQRRGGFSDSAIDAENFAEVIEGYEQGLRDRMEGDDRMEDGDERDLPDIYPPDFQFLGSSLVHADATLTPEIIQETFFSDPDAEDLSDEDKQLHYLLIPNDPDLVRFHWMSQAKGSRASFGCGKINMRVKDEETGAWEVPGELSKDDQRAQRNIDAVNSQIERLALAGKNVLVICPKAIEPNGPDAHKRIKTLQQFHRAPGTVSFMTWGSVAGKNGFEQADALVIVSEAVPDVRELENMAIAISGKPVQRIEKFEDCDLTTHSQNDKSGRHVPSSRPVHPDPLVEAIRWSQMEGQVIQAIERARGVRRGRATYDLDGNEVIPAHSEPLDVYLFNRLIVDYEPDYEIKQMRSLMPSEFEMVEREGVWIEDVAVQGAKNIYEAMKGEELERGAWRHLAEKERTRRSEPGYSPPDWPSAIGRVPAVEGRSSRKITIRVRADAIDAIRAKGIELKLNPEDHVGAIIEGLLDDWMPVDQLKAVISAICGEAPSTQGVKKLMNEHGEFKRTEKGWVFRRSGAAM